tara:strand:+ start:757 stop:996 length:240 start_codon:yes stop_codon:yes gene_type:complete
LVTFPHDVLDNDYKDLAEKLSGLTILIAESSGEYLVYQMPIAGYSEVHESVNNSVELSMFFELTDWGNSSAIKTFRIFQ